MHGGRDSAELKLLPSADEFGHFYLIAASTDLQFLH
jgi:hypothetical protein